MKKYDLTNLRQMASGDEEFFIEMLRTFVQELPEDVQAMNQAVENHNPQLTFQIAHKMKPNLQMFGLDLSEEVKKLEHWSKDKSTKEEILPEAKKISDTVLQVCQEIKEDYNI